MSRAIQVARILAETELLEVRLDVARADVASSPTNEILSEAFRQSVAAARSAAARCQEPWKPPWVRARLQEAAQTYLDAADVLLVDLLPQSEVKAMVPEVSYRLTALREAGDPAAFDMVWNLRNPDPQIVRATVRKGLEWTHHRAAVERARILSILRIIELTAVVVSVLLLTAVVVGVAFPDAIPLCSSRVVELPGGQAGHVTTCPAGGDAPTGADVLVVVFAGIIGATFAAALALRSIRGTSVPYDVPLASALLKMPLGGAFALGGIVLLTGGFLPGLWGPESATQYLAYAAVFGFAQQLASAPLDRRAQEILSVSEPPSLRPPDERAALGTSTSTTDLPGAMADTVQASLTEALRGAPVVNVEGVLEVDGEPTGPGELAIRIAVRTGATARTKQTATAGSRMFHLTGGQDMPAAAMEVVIDAAGATVTPERQAAEVLTEDGSQEWQATVTGEWTDATVWVTLYSSGRYVQALRWTAAQAPAATRAPSDQDL